MKEIASILTEECIFSFPPLTPILQNQFVDILPDTFPSNNHHQPPVLLNANQPLLYKTDPIPFQKTNVP